jgi:phosphate transport system substrate-binding protein
MIDMKKLIKYRGRKAVSPVVATLILIIVAIVGAVAVGLIVSGIGTQTSKNANVGNDQSQAQTQILIGGSASMLPAVQAAATAYGSANGINVIVQAGGSGAGYEGVAENVLNIGDVGAYSSVVSAISQYPSANLQAVEVGGSGIVVILNEVTGSSLAGCTGITVQALQALYKDGYGQIAPACTGTGATSLIDVTGGAGAAILTPQTSPTGATVTAVSRSDLPSGAEDTFCSYVGSICSSTSNNVNPLPGVTETGDSGVLTEVQNTKGAIGFVDLGFAEGAATNPGQTQVVTGITIAELQATDTAAYTQVECSSGSFTSTGLNPSTGVGDGDCYAPTGTSTVALDNYMKYSLSETTSGSYVYPDVASGTSSTGLTRTFWMVTSGAPSTIEQAFITYIRSPAATSFWTNAGFYSIYSLTPITPP